MDLAGIILSEISYFLLKRDVNVMSVSLFMSLSVSLCLCLCLSLVLLELEDTIKWTQWHGGLIISFYTINLLITCIFSDEFHVVYS